MRNPVRVLALKRELPVRMRAQKDPMAAKGMENINTTGVENDSKTDANII